MTDHLAPSKLEGHLIFLKPEYKERIWGGTRLSSGEYCPGIDSFGEQKIGEAWIMSAHPHGDCRICSGEFEGKHLSEVYASRKDLFGNVDYEFFPLMFKIIDAGSDLSIQVHPDDEYASKHESFPFGKSECWYVLDAADDAQIVVGQKAQNREEFEEAIVAGNWDEVLNRIPVHKGDFFQISPGCVHAICAGTLVIEPQQSSDVTYRLYDYDRLQADGSKRELHIKKSLDVIDFEAEPLASGELTAPVIEGTQHLTKTSFYEVDRVVVEDTRELKQVWSFLCLACIEGSGTICGQTIEAGQACIACADVDKLTLEGNFSLISMHLPHE